MATQPEAPWKFKFAGVGRYVPKRVVPSAEVEALCNIPEGRSVRFNGVKERRWVDLEAGESATFMGAEAAKEAIEEAGLEPDDLDLIINASGTVRQAIPDGACFLQRELGLADSGIPCMSIHTTCLSFVAAVDVAAAYIATERAENILIVSSDIASVGLNKEEAESFTLFGDMAAAAVLIPTPEGESSGMHRYIFETYSSGADLTVIRGGGTHCHPNASTTVPADNCFSMRGPEVLKLAVDLLPPYLSRLCPKHEPPVDLVVPHQSSKTAMRVARKIFKEYARIENDQIVDILENYGNCVSASIPSAFYHAVRSGQLKRGDRFMMVGTGAGLSLGGAVFTY